MPNVERGSDNTDPLTYDDLARVALAFILEDENWWIFEQWCLDVPHSSELHHWLATHTVHDARLLWLANAPESTPTPDSTDKE